jgi:hypothetical protein
MKKILNISNLSFAILTFIATAGLKSIAQTAPENVTINSVETSGSGCPEGTAHVTMAPDNQSMTVLFDNFVAESNGNKLLSILNCDVKVEFSVPRGWQYSIEGIDYRGGVSASVGSIAKHQSQFFVLNPRNKWKLLSNILKKYNFKNTSTGNYIIHKDIKFSSVKPGCCHEDTSTLLWKTAISAETVSHRDSSYAYISVDSIDAAQVGQKINLKWKRCH